jgi:hypothetical protein
MLLVPKACRIFAGAPPTEIGPPKLRRREASTGVFIARILTASPPGLVAHLVRDEGVAGSNPASYAMIHSRSFVPHNWPPSWRRRGWSASGSVARCPTTPTTFPNLRSPTRQKCGWSPSKSHPRGMDRNRRREIITGERVAGVGCR